MELAKVKDKYPISMPEKDPRRVERDAIISSYLAGMLQQGVCNYELAQSYPAGSSERAKYLDEALKQFTDLYNSNRQQWAGLTAQMWQAKCFEEKGDIGAAIGIYKSLLEHTEPQLRGLQRYVGYFYIVALGKRKEYALAADQANLWLRVYNRRDEVRSKEGLGVQLELAKAIDAQMKDLSDADRGAGRAPDHRLLEPGRAILLALQERGPGPPEEVQADLRDEGRGDRPSVLPGCHGESRRGDGLQRLAAGDRPPESRHLQGGCRAGG